MAIGRNGDWVVVDRSFSEVLGVDWLSADLGVDWLVRTNDCAGDGVDFAGLRAEWLVCGVRAGDWLRRAGDWLRRAANWLPICLADGFAVGVTAFKGFWKN